MEYRFTDTNKAAITFDIALGDVSDLRDLLQKVLAGDVSDVSRWRVRALVRKLADAQRQAVDIMRMDADTLAEKAKLPDDL